MTKVIFTLVMKAGGGRVPGDGVLTHGGWGPDPPGPPPPVDPPLPLGGGGGA